MPTFSALTIVLLAALQTSAAQTYWTTPAFLKDCFSHSERVSFVKVSHAAAAAVLGDSALKEHYVVFVAKSGEHIDGYAVVDDEPGQHEPITFGIQLSPEGQVRRTEVMSYREPYGGEIAQPAFQKQFIGKGPADALLTGHDVAAISGATISSRSMARAVRRALVLVDLVRKRAIAGGVLDPTEGH